MIRYYCQFCGKKSEKVFSNVQPDDWVELYCKVSWVYSFTWDVCPDCSERLDIKKSPSTSDELLISAIKSLIEQAKEE